MAKFLVSAERAAKFIQSGQFAVHQAKSAACMVEIDPEKLQIYPVAPQFHEVIELYEHEYMPLDLQSRPNPKAP